MKLHAEIVLKAMLTGKEIEFKDGQTYRLFKTGDEFKTPSGMSVCDMPYWAGIRVLTSKGMAWIGANLSLTDFLSLCDQLSEEEVVLIAGETVLREINQKKRGDVQ